MLGILDHILFVALAVMGPLWSATAGYRRLRLAPPEARVRVRRSVYRATIAMQWTLAAALLQRWVFTHRPWSWIGLAPLFTWGLAGVLLGSVIAVTFIAVKRREALDDDEALAEVRERMRHLSHMLPRSPAELRGFAALSVTAGICEELLYRGFMIFYLTQFTNLIAAAALAAVLFGLGHAYQGVRGMLLTAMVGAFLAAVYLLSGSLFVPMALHVLMDLHSGHLGHVALRREAELA